MRYKIVTQCVDSKGGNSGIENVEWFEGDRDGWGMSCSVPMIREVNIKPLIDKISDLQEGIEVHIKLCVE